MKLQQLFTPIQHLQETEAIAFITTLQHNRAYTPIKKVKRKKVASSRKKKEKGVIALTQKQLKVLKEAGLI